MKWVLWVALASSLCADPLTEKRQHLQEIQQQALCLYETEAQSEEYLRLLKELQEVRGEVDQLEEAWRKAQGAQFDEPFALWDIGETTVSQLVMEYGGTDALYIVPPEVAAMKIYLYSSLPFPRISWPEMIEAILIHNGLGIKKLNPYVKQLYILKLDPSTIEGVLSRPEDLALFGPHARLFYVFSPPAEQARWVQAFFERFSDPKGVSIQTVGSKVAVVAPRESIEHLLQLYRAVWETDRGKGVRLITLAKLDPSEAEKVLKALFAEGTGRNGRPAHFATLGIEELTTLVLPQGLVLMGDVEAVSRAEQILVDLELQCEDPQERVIFWYACKHSAPDEVAEVLGRVYASFSGSEEEEESVSDASPEPASALVKPETASRRRNFVVDPKTGSILMVVRRDEVGKIKGLLKRLDVPKRMVQIDVLLVEKRIQDRRQSGINLLQIGSTATERNQNAVNFNAQERGLLQFLLSRPASKYAGFDLAYQFLLAQDDLRINANPSVIAVNQTPATISIVEEISINNGAVTTEAKRTNGIEKSFTRAQFGITIAMTPTIHISEEEEGFVSLATNVTFETVQTLGDDRPPVTRRHIENEVRIADGETVILGGLRKRAEEETREKIPFLGDIPWIGKLFGATRATDTNTEMLIFITPHIIRNPTDDLRRLREETVQRRVGDIPEFLDRLLEAKHRERAAYFEQSLKLLVDRL